MIILDTIIYAALIVMDIRGDRSSKQPWIVWPCLVLFALGFVIQALHELGASIPSPAMPIDQFISGIFNLK